MPVPLTLDVVDPDKVPLPDASAFRPESADLIEKAVEIGDSDEARESVRELVGSLYRLLEPQLLDRASSTPADGITTLGVGATYGYGFAQVDESLGTPPDQISDDVWSAMALFAMQGPSELPPWLAMWAGIAVRIGYYVGRQGDTDAPEILAMAQRALADG